MTGNSKRLGAASSGNWDAPTYMTHNDPHNMRIMLRYLSWNSSNECPRAQATGRLGTDTFALDSKSEVGIGC